MKTPEEFAKEEGFFNSPHFPMTHVTGLMKRYSDHRVEELGKSLLEVHNKLQWEAPEMYETLQRFDEWIGEVSEYTSQNKIGRPGQVSTKCLIKDHKRLEAINQELVEALEKIYPWVDGTGNPLTWEQTLDIGRTVNKALKKATS